MIPTLSPRALRRLSTLALALCVALAASYVPHERSVSSAAAFGVRAGAAPLTGVLAHAGARGGFRTAALGRGATGSSVVSAHEAHSLRTLAGVRARRLTRLVVGELSMVREPKRRSRPVGAAPHRSRVASAATPRAPPRV